MVPRQIFTRFAKFQSFVSINDFLGHSDKSRNFRETSFCLLRSFRFAGVRLNPWKWLNLVPRLSIDGCFEVHILHKRLCDLPLSSQQTFLLEVELRQCVFCKGPLSSWFRLQTSQFWSFGKWVLILCFLDATLTGCSELQSWEKCAGTGIFCPLHCLSSNRSRRSRKRSSESRLSFLFLFWFWMIGSVSLQFPEAGSSRRSAAGLVEDKILRCQCWRRIAPRTGG